MTPSVFLEVFRKLSEFSDFPFNSYKRPREGTFKNLTIKRLLKAPKTTFKIQLKKIQF
jgi:hypothetical protein